MLTEAEKIIKNIGSRENLTVSGFSSLAGGSINEVFLLDTCKGKIVMKLNDASSFPGMFEAEKEGLEALKDSKTVDVPEVLSFGTLKHHAYLLLEFKPEDRETKLFWENFARELAALHKTSSPKFGFPSSNYIGSLPQTNEERESAGEFYIDQRLEPQFQMAKDRGFSFGNLDQTFKNICSAIPEEPASLIHGDLWNGNYMATANARPCLIDPAVSFSSREMDLSMMKLFGGFPEKVFEDYSDIFPLESGFKERVPLWQLYYLLVHLNIFGSSYLGSVKQVLKRYS